MATAQRLEANRNNSRHSTRPKTESGKSVSAKNALRHGLASGMLIARWERREEYDALLADLVEEHQPATATETILVHQLAQHHWLAQRAIFLQQQAFVSAKDSADAGDQLAVFIRYQTANERAFHKALATLIKPKSDKKKQEIGFVSQRPAPREIDRAQAAAEPLSGSQEKPRDARPTSSGPEPPPSCTTHQFES